MKHLTLLLLTALCLPAAIVPEVRQLLNQQDFAGAEKLIETTRNGGAWTPELIEAHSWLGRAAVAGKQYDKALAYSAASRKLALAALKGRTLDQERRLPIGLGASIEVEGQALAGKGQLSEAITFLNKELKTWYKTSIRTRIQKNINLLSLVGKPAPALEIKDSIGPNKPLALSALKGKAVLLFFWAHWCSDCKAQSPIIADLAKAYAPKGLVVVGPTQHYGYVAGGEDATPAVEKPYIGKIYDQFYAGIPSMAAPLSEENFRVYGSSTTPTLVLVNRKGIVTMYNPGNLKREDLAARIEKALE